MSPLAWSNSPITVLGGELKSFTADPSRKNSGLWQTPKSAPAFFPENSSRMGITMHGSRQDGAADSHGVPRVFVCERLPNLFANAPDIPQIEVPIGLAWGTDADQGKLRFPNGLGLVVGGAQPTRTNIGCNDLIELRFDNRRSAVVYQFNLFLNRVNTDDFVAVICETSRRHRTDVAQSKNADIH